MNRSAGAGSRERARVLNAVPLQNAVLCAECDVVSDSPHDVCMVCGSHSPFNVARIFGGKLPQKRVSMITQPAVAEGFSLETVLVFPKRQLSVVALEGEGAQPQHGMLVGSQSD